MARTNEHHDPSLRAAWPVGRARALAILFVLAGFLLAPFIVAAGKPQSSSLSDIAQVVSSPSKANKGCPKKSLLPGQPNACASSSVPVAGLDNRSAAPAPVAERSSAAPIYEVTLSTQCCGTPPDRPPRLAA